MSALLCDFDDDGISDDGNVLNGLCSHDILYEIRYPNGVTMTLCSNAARELEKYVAEPLLLTGDIVIQSIRT